MSSLNFFQDWTKNLETRKGEGKESICQEIVMVFGFTPELISKCGMSIIHILFFKEEKFSFFFKEGEANWWRTGMLPAISQLHFCSWLNIFFPSNPPPSVLLRSHFERNSAASFIFPSCKDFNAKFSNFFASFLGLHFIHAAF